MKLPVEAYLPAVPDLLNKPDARSREAYLATVRQFDVLRSPRYQPRNGNTYCNIFAVDAMCAMSAPLPYWVAPDGSVGGVTQANFEANANWLAAWLGCYGPRQGWVPCLKDEAVARAKVGKPTVVAWLNFKRPSKATNSLGAGHIAVVIPSDYPGVRIAQAGGSNLFDVDVSHGFGSSRLEMLNYYTHE